MPPTIDNRRNRSTRPAQVGSPAGGTDSGQGSGPLSDAYVAELERRPDPGSGQRVQAPANVSRMEVRCSSRVASRPQSAQLPTMPSSFVLAPPGARKAAGYVYEVLPSIADASPSLCERHSGPSDPPGTVDDSRDISLPQPSLVPASGGFVGRKRAATSEVPHSPRRGSGPVDSLHAFPAPLSMAQALTSPANPTTPARSTRSNRAVEPVSSPIASNPLLHHPVAASVHTPSPGRRRSLSLRTRDSHAAWAAAEGLLPIPDAFQTPGYVPAHIVGGITYDVRAPRLQHPRPAGPEVRPDHPFTGPPRHPSERPQRERSLAPAIAAIPTSHARSIAASVRFFTSLCVNWT
ncbi:hypothetical protein BYT27DRAFT_7105965 [Phlegmacium glaucopus]|nr:hypothetical protein BYT27DRAFT_7105965 [Phlegmacium glaucopus]